MAKPLSILILCSYFNRPLLVRNALNSILKANEYHQNWELAFGDDGSHIPGRPIVEEVLKDHLNKVRFYQSDMKFEDKIEQGLILGRMANVAMENSDADVAIILCDDDELVPTYLRGLSEYFSSHPKILYCYSKIHLYNPFYNTSASVDNSVVGRYNNYNGPIDPVGKVDASQVAWRLACCKKRGAWFAESTKLVEGRPWTKDTDKSFFENLYSKCGEAHFSGLVGQYKGIHDYQLLWHKDVAAAQLWAYNKMVLELGGKVF
jgi:hypothetical protein